MYVVGRIGERPTQDGYTDEILDGLAPFGFWGAVHHHAFVQPEHFEWAARNLVLTRLYLERHPVDYAVAATFCEFFPQKIPETGEGYYWWPCTRLRQPEDLARLRMYFRAEPELYQEIVRVAEAHRLPVEFFRRYMDPTIPSPW